MFSVTVRDHMMVAHSFHGDLFGPAQRLHGATYEVRAEVLAQDVDEDGIVIDIGLLRTALRATLAPLEYRNLDEVPELVGENTTTEFLCRWVHDRLAERLEIQAGTRLRITLVESPTAWAAYESE